MGKQRRTQITDLCHVCLRALPTGCDCTSYQLSAPSLPGRQRAVMQPHTRQSIGIGGFVISLSPVPKRTRATDAGSAPIDHRPSNSFRFEFQIEPRSRTSQGRWPACRWRRAKQLAIDQAATPCWRHFCDQLISCSPTPFQLECSRPGGATGAQLT